MKKNTQQGFGPLAIIIVIALLAILGGGAYYAKHKSTINTNVDVATNTTDDTSTGGSAGIDGTLRGLLTLGHDSKCTIADSGNGTSGTVYIAGTSMRGDFTLKGSSGTEVDSHMVRLADMMYVWSGSQGAKMNIADMNTSTSGAAHNSVNLDQKVHYSCTAWLKDASRFTIPSPTVSFVDISAMLHTNGGVPLPH